MPRKESDNTPTQTAISLLVYLLENGESHSLTNLAEKFNVSKQTISRTLERGDLTFFGKLIKEKSGKEVVYRLDKSSLLKRLMRAGLKSGTQNRTSPSKNSGKKISSDNMLAEIVRLEINPRKDSRRLVVAVLEKLLAKGSI